jgi:hypothetical protein
LRRGGILIARTKRTKILSFIFERLGQDITSHNPDVDISHRDHHFETGVVGSEEALVVTSLLHKGSDVGNLCYMFKEPAVKSRHKFAHLGEEALVAFRRFRVRDA